MLADDDCTVTLGSSLFVSPVTRDDNISEERGNWFNWAVNAWGVGGTATGGEDGFKGVVTLSPTKKQKKTTNSHQIIHTHSRRIT